MRTTADEGTAGLASPTFRPDVQGLRAIAVGIVVLYHAGLSFGGGFVGVDVFFVLSGFVIIRGLRFELAKTGSVDLVAFAQRRIRRLLPALALLLAVVLPLGLVFSPVDGFQPGAMAALSAVLFNANTFFQISGDGYFSTSAELNPLLHTWSLSVEEQFYFVFPAAALLSWKMGRRFNIGGLRGLFVALLAVGAVSLIAAEVLASGLWGHSFGTPWGRVIIDERAAFFSTPTRAWEFAAGALVGLVGPTKSDKVASALCVGGLGAIAACCVLYSSPGTTFPGLAAVVPVGATAALLSAGGRGPVGRLLQAAPLQRIGDLSYGWYLWHWPLIVYVRGLTVNTAFDSPWIVGSAALLALVPAELSMRLVENPIRKSTSLQPRHVGLLGLACGLIPLVVTAGSVLAWGALHRDTVESMEEQFAIHLDASNGCDSNFSEGAHDGTCAFPADEDRGTVALIGDSNAGHFSEGLRQGVAMVGYDLEVITRSSCLFADVRTAPSGFEAADCGQAVEQTTQELIDTDVDVVVLGHAADYYIDDPAFGVIDEVSGEMVFDSDTKREIIAAGFANKVAELTNAGIEVVVMQPVPRVAGWEPGACSVIRWSDDGTGCPSETPVGRVVAQLGTMEPINRAIIAAGGRVMDVSGELCDAQTCSVVVDGDYVYRDALHLSVAGSESLAGLFATAVSEPATLPDETMAFTD